MKTAYPNTREPVSITLYRNVPFDNTYKHHTMISDRFMYLGVPIYNDTGNNGLPCERFLNIQYRQGSNYYYLFPRTTKPSEVYNFEYGNGLITKITLELTPAETNSNYMKVVCGNDVYYYFITAISQTNFETYELTLELDVLMTYQDEFIEGIDGVPVFTKRKHSHRFTDDGLVPYCADFKTGDSAFAGVKPSLLNRIKPLHFFSENARLIEGLYWLYVCLDNKFEVVGASDLSPLFTCKGKTYPMSMVVAPIGDFTSITYQKSDGTLSQTFTYDEIVQGITKLIGDGSVHGCKVSPYPPFDVLGLGNITIQKSQKAYSIQCDTIDKEQGLELYRMRAENNILYYGTNLPTGTALLNLVNQGFMVIASQGDTKYQLENLLLSDLGMVNNDAPTITSSRYDDPKLLFSPFKKYILTSQYASEGYQFYPELELSNTPLSSNTSLCGFITHTTAYIGDNNYYTEITKSDISSVFNLYKYEKLGLSSNINYTIPCGTDALDVFNTTQQQSFYTSKVASGITSGLGIAGGVASIVIGAGMTAGSGGGLTPVGMGMVAGGIGGIASGTAGVATTIASSVKHIEDLKNTPQSINVSGGNFQFDDAVLGEETNGKPYIVVYDVPQVIKDNANDYFYQYGYEVARCCYFNTDIWYSASYDKVDDSLFGRTIFNYIQLNEDITNKIRSDIPMIVKKKLSSIFNEGITIWNFFGFDFLWKSQKDAPSNGYIYRWFMNNLLDNTEYKQ